MNRSALFLLFAMAACSTLQASPVTAEQDAAALIGVEYTRIGGAGQQISPDSSCLIQGGGSILKDGTEVFEDTLGWGYASCQGRYTILLTRQIGSVNIGNKDRWQWRVLNAVILPPTSFMDLTCLPFFVPFELETMAS